MQSQVALDVSVNSAASNVHLAIDAWNRELGEDRVVASSEGIRKYTNSTIGVRRRVTAVLRPQDANQVASLVRIAAQYRVPLYPISTGKNWGYGAANPVEDDCVIVDLSTMDRILDFDEELGIVTLEPGVTQGKLWKFLDDRGSPFMVPVHGGGPDCSILGNALERGYGLTPHADHFAALTSLEAVLANGENYRSPLAELNGLDVDRAFKWGIGPYMDGLFSQGNFGIVTRASIALAPRPRCTEAFLFSFGDEASLGEMVTAVRELLRELGSNIGSLNLMNAHRVLAMLAPYPANRVSEQGTLPAEVIAELARHYDVSPWMGAGILYGDPGIVRTARAMIKRRLRPLSKQLLFLNQGKVEWLRRVGGVIPLSRIQRRVRQLDAIEGLLNIAQGRPQRVALPLAYWKSGIRPNLEAEIDPAADNCGLIWYSPLAAMKPDAVTRLVEMVTRVCPQYGVEPLITLTTLNERVFDSTIPLIFRKDDRHEFERAHACFDALLREGKSIGAIPYRVGVHRMQSVTSNAPCWRMARRLKEAVDPDGIIAPGRYNLRESVE